MCRRFADRSNKSFARDRLRMRVTYPLARLGSIPTLMRRITKSTAQILIFFLRSIISRLSDSFIIIEPRKFPWPAARRRKKAPRNLGDALPRALPHTRDPTYLSFWGLAFAEQPCEPIEIECLAARNVSNIATAT